jgi:tRNA-Thr(GGU) m(6)t(6)A37 methyltransferase TsaA
VTLPKPASVTYEAIGHVCSPHKLLEGMPLQSVAAQHVTGRIELLPKFRGALKDLDGFSHVWVISHLHLSEAPTEPVVVPFLDDVERGLFATRSPRHPNPIGISVVRLLSIDGTTLQVVGLDLVDKTPVLDLKPFVPLFDGAEAERTGWLEAKAEDVYVVRSDKRFQAPELPRTDEELARTLTYIETRREPSISLLAATSTHARERARPCVRDVMCLDPRTVPHHATIGEVRQLFDNPRIRVALLVQHGTCIGVIGRGNIEATARDEDAAGSIARTPETIPAEASLAQAHRALVGHATGRLVVVDEHGKLQGLLCLKHSGTGFCSKRSPCRPAPDSESQKSRWRILRTSGSIDHRQGLLLAPHGKRFSLGDTLTLPPPGDDTRWLVIDVSDDPDDSAAGILTVEPLEL